VNEKTGTNTNIKANISGTNSGQVAVGTHINQIASPPPAPPDQAEIESLRQMLAELRERVAAQAPVELQQPALERVNELEEALTGKEPDLSTMEYVTGWFARQLPGIAGAVAGVIVHPIVGKLVEAAGDALSAEFQRRFGG
jgi:hypothetical protein